MIWKEKTFSTNALSSLMGANEQFWVSREEVWKLRAR
jgi:hypothetical protein